MPTLPRGGTCGGDDGASISVLIRQFNAWATVDTYEDILADVASAVRDGVLEARLPVPGFFAVEHQRGSNAAGAGGARYVYRRG